MWVKLWARHNCLCLALLTQQLLNPRKCSFSGLWLLLWPQNKNCKAYMLLVLAFLPVNECPVLRVIRILSLFNILLNFCDLKQLSWSGVCVRDRREVAVQNTGFISPIVFILWSENRRRMAEVFLNSSCAKLPVRPWMLCNLHFVVCSPPCLLEPFVMRKAQYPSARRSSVHSVVGQHSSASLHTYWAFSFAYILIFVLFCFLLKLAFRFQMVCCSMTLQGHTALLVLKIKAAIQTI